MSLHPSRIGAVPTESARVAALAFPRGTVATRLRDEFTALYEDEDFHTLYPRRGQPAMLPWRLALVTVLQFQKHLSDSGDVDAELIPKSERCYGVALHGPMRGLSAWTSRAGYGYDLSRFRIDWVRREVTCPEGRRSVTWTEGRDGAGAPRIHARFSRTDCGVCPARTRCTPTKAARRAVYFHPRELFEALGAACSRMREPAWLKGYVMPDAGRRHLPPPSPRACRSWCRSRTLSSGTGEDVGINRVRSDVLRHPLWPVHGSTHQPTTKFSLDIPILSVFTENIG